VSPYRLGILPHELCVCGVAGRREQAGAARWTGGRPRHAPLAALHARRQRTGAAGEKRDLPKNGKAAQKCELCDWRFPNLNFLAYHIKAKHC
jgi:hypothetical protein